MIALVFWLAEFLLESLGAHLAWRARIRPLGIYLGFRAGADLTCFAALLISPRAYAWVDYVQRSAQYILFAVLATYLCSRLLWSDRFTLKFYSWSFALWTASALIWFHSFARLTAESVLGFEFAVDIFCGALVTLPLIAGNGIQPWKRLADAALVMACSDGLLALAQRFGWNVTAYYPVGAIAALGMFAWAVWPKNWNEARLGLAPQLEVTSVIWKERSRMVN